MEDRNVFRDWLELREEGRFLVKNMKDNTVYDKEQDILIQKAIDLDFLEIKNEDKLFKTKKYKDFKKNKVPQILKINNLKKKLMSGLETEENINFILDVFEERIADFRKEVKGIVKTYEECEHDFIPFKASWRLDIFKADRLYTWNYKCTKCDATKFEKTKNEEEKPKGFENISPTKLMLYN